MNALNIPSRRCGYVITISPPEWMNRQMEDIRSEFVERRENDHKQLLNPNILVTKFVGGQGEQSDKSVVECVKKIASLIHSFNVTCTGFRFSEADPTLRVKVREEESLASLDALLRSELQAGQLSTKPQSVAGGELSGSLLAEGGDSGGTRYELTDWSSTNNFRVDSLTVLKQDAERHWSYLVKVPLGRA